LAFFKNKVGIKDDLDQKDEDVLLMADILNDVKNTDIDIYAGLNDTQKASLNEILDRYKGGEGNHELLLEQDDGEKIIKKIEEIVNQKFSEKKIINIKIDQVDDETYKFNDKKAHLHFENEVLKVEGGVTFEEWIVTNFNEARTSVIGKKGSGTQGNNAKLSNATKLDKKSIASDGKRSITPTKQKV